MDCGRWPGSTSARSSATARAARGRGGAGARCARSSRPTATGTGRCRPRARRRPAGRAWLAVATAERGAGLRAAGVDGPLLVMGALSPEELEVALAARADVVGLARGLRRPALPPGDAGVHVKLDTGMGRLGTRDPDGGAARSPRPPRPPGCGSRAR